MSIVIISVISVTVMGVICAIVLSVASKLMFVKVDERVALLQEIMPGVNCGVCGYPGCAGYAKALLTDSRVKPNLCTPGGSSVLAKISDILGIEAGYIDKKSAIVHCMGDNVVQHKKMEYKGIQSCEAANQLYGGDTACAFGCLGYGDCKKVCPTNAICMEHSLARINANLCTGCALCLKVCPNNLISIESFSKPVFILCMNTEKGAATRKKCTHGCIACTKCVKECPKNAMSIVDNLARIDYEKCDGCERCVEVCVTKCIHAEHIPNA